MATAEHHEAPKIVHELADAFSKQSKYSNQVWLALIATATLVLFPDIGNNGVVKLPFSLGLVDGGTYKVVGFLILTILMISYCQAHARAHIAIQFAHTLISELEPKSRRVEARKFFDNLIISTFARVSALAELTGMVRFAAIYYSLLKLVANAVIFGIPAWALIAAYIQLVRTPPVAEWIQWFSLIAMCITSFAVLQILYIESRHTIRVTALYWTGHLTSNS